MILLLIIFVWLCSGATAYMILEASGKKFDASNYRPATIGEFVECTCWGGISLLISMFILAGNLYKYYKLKDFFDRPLGIGKIDNGKNTRRNNKS